MKRLLGILVLMALAALFYHKSMARFGSGSPPPMVDAEQQVDFISVRKSQRTLSLFKDGQPISIFRIALGAAGDEGSKRQEGDGRTPEGLYKIDWRNARSAYHLSLHISYPDAHAISDASRRGVVPGSNIMIHGLPNGWGWLGPVHRLLDWTDGCIAVTNAEMRDIWSRVPDGTPIQIEP
ncbi:MAG: hypothetical protein H6Q99_2658 [Proteobacteria bacterium]|nr:hypothetical protein [Pseudomonadota bacterium]